MLKEWENRGEVGLRCWGVVRMSEVKLGMALILALLIRCFEYYGASIRFIL